LPSREFFSSLLEKSRTLGGDVLTAEAETIAKTKGFTVQQMFEDAQGNKDLVWTKDSQARVNIKSTLSFIGLIGFGTCALASASMLIAVFTTIPPVSK
jgi:hypothetical protein